MRSTVIMTTVKADDDHMKWISGATARAASTALNAEPAIPPRLNSACNEDMIGVR